MDDRRSRPRSEADSPFAEHLRRKGYTYTKAGAALGVSAETIGRIARGKTPTVEIAKLIEERLGFPARKLLGV